MLPSVTRLLLPWCRRALFPLGVLIASVVVWLLLAACGGGNDLIVGTTTSVRDSGLYDILVPEFEKQTDYNVKIIAVGTGAALKLGERGEVDVLVVHAPSAETEFIDAGHGVDRRLIMYNFFLIVGPPDDPAGIKGMKSSAEALKAIAEREALFVSRGDESGTHKKEIKVWESAGIDPVGQSWYQEAGQGMGQTLIIASEKAGYTLTDLGTYLHNKNNLNLDPMVEGDPVFINTYSVIRVNPDKYSDLNVEGALAWADFLVAPETQEMIGDYGVKEFGQPLFIPAAGQDESTLGR